MTFEKKQIVKAKLIEKVNSDEWIVSFSGKLYKVKNQSSYELKESQIISLYIKTINPLVLSFIDENKLKYSREVNIKV